jgi:GDP-L-fucose synthase
MKKKVLITGSNGMVGKDLISLIEEEGLYTICEVPSKQYDLRESQEVFFLFSTYKPDIVIHLAAKVGGIVDNIEKPGEYTEDNLLMNTNVISMARKFGVERLIGILSTCAYPDKVETYPMSEENLHDGPPAPTNFGYGISKRCMASHIDSINKQYGLKYQYLIPCNLYGEHDKFDEQRAHFISALIKKIIDAKNSGSDKITLFGDGTPMRQFMHSQDLAKIIYDCIKNEIVESMNVATEENLTINEMAKIALTSCDADHIKIEYDKTKPNGQFRKDVSIQKLRKYFPDFKFTTLSEGIKKIYKKHAKAN